MPLRLLHVSDIHFQDSGWDEDLDQRRELVRDVKQLSDRDGNMNAILVGGDIAFGATPPQYDKARLWLDELSDASGGLEPGDIWVVPGNHDIHRETVDASSTARAFRHDLLACTSQEVDFLLHERLSKDPARDGLMLPLANYNDFAMGFNCTTSAESPSWWDESLAVDGLSIRLTGINSALTSRHDSEIKGKMNLVVGSHQCHLDRRDNLIHVALLHHPPHWLKDWDVVGPYLNRAHVLLFGHEHAFEARQSTPGGTVEISAGAVAPERQPGGEQEPYVACYNIITLSYDGGSHLEVLVQPRYWSKPRTRYVDHPDGPISYQVALEPAVHPPTPAEHTSQEPIGLADQVMNTSSAAPLADNPPQTAGDAAQPADERQNLRRIGVRFLNLTVTKRREIARNLNILSDDDLALSASELWPTVLKRVRDRGLTNALYEELKR